MKRLLCLALAVFFAAPAVHAQGPSQNPIVVTNCGTPYTSFAPGNSYTPMMDVNGNYCVSGGSGGASPTSPTYTAPVAGSSPTSTTASAGQLTGTPIDLQLAGGAQFQISGLNVDSVAVTQGMGPNCATATYVTATVLKQDLTTTAATALTGTTANGIYSPMVFGGCLKFARTGTADTLVITFRGTP